MFTTPNDRECETTRSPRFRARRAARRGYLYVAVLFTAIIVSGAVLTAVSLDTVRIKTQNAATDRGSAIRLAESELHRVSVLLSANPTWREDLTQGSNDNWIQYGNLMGAANAGARFSLIDDDGDLADDVFDPIQVIAYAEFGSAIAAVSVVLENGFAPLDLLRYGVSVFDDLECENGASLVSERAIQVFDQCRGKPSGEVTTSALACSGTIELNVRGDLTTARMQQPSFDVVGRYADVGTEIPLASLPIWNGSRAIALGVVSTTANSYGAADAGGIYWIDAQGQEIAVVNSRIVATIAIRNASRVYLTGALSWEAPGDEGVILVTDADVEFDAVEPVLDEITLGVNFNPPETPYRGIDSNVSLSDRFPTEFRGIIYTASNMIVRPTSNGDPLAITGALICYDMTLFHSLFVRAYPEVLMQVPRGFADPQPLRFRTGTFRRVETR